MLNAPLPEGLGTLLRNLLGRLDPVVDAVYAAEVPAMRSRFYPVMRELLGRERALVSELAAAVGVSQPAMTQTVAQMVAAGLLESIEGEDRRERLISLSEQGQQAAARLRPIWGTVSGAAQTLDAELSMPLSDILKEAIAALERRDFARRIADTRSEDL